MIISTDPKERIGYHGTYWWLKAKGDCHKTVFENAKEYFRKWGSNYFELIGHKNRYEEREIATGINVSPWSKIRGSKYLSANVTASAIDTLVSKVAKQVPSVQYITNGANWYEQQQARELQKYVQGTFLQKDVAGVLAREFSDCCKVGTGFILMDDIDGKLVFKNFPAYQVMCDWLDAQSGEPVDIHFVEVISRFKLMQRFPEHKEELLKTTTSLHFFTETNLNSKDSVVVIHSYNTFAGRRSITVDNCTLRDDDTLLDTSKGLKNRNGEPMAPYVALTYKDTSFGLFSIGVAEELRPLHDVIDKTLRIIQRSAHLLAVPKLIVSRQANVVESHLDNEIAGIIHADGSLQNAIYPVPMGKIPTDLEFLVRYYYELAFKKVGLSELTATSKNPANLTSGKALQTYFDIESDRFASTAKKYERSVIDLNYLVIKYSRYLQQQGYTMKANFYGRDIQKEINFKDVDLDENYFDIQAFPVSVIPQTPSGRYETVRDMIQIGLLDNQRALKLLDIPDIENDTYLQNSQLDFVRYQVYQMMQGIPQSPEERQDMNFVVEEAEKHYYYYRQKEVPYETLDLLSNYIEQAKIIRDRETKSAQIVEQSLMQQAMQQQQQQAQQQGSALGGSNE